MAGSGELQVAAAASRRRCDEWALVLASQGLAPRVVAAGDGWAVQVGPDEAERARAVLEAYALENRSAPPVATAPEWQGPGPFRLALLGAAGLLLFHGVTGPADAGSPWFERGAATARIVGGEPWRAITALTLHADSGHVLANALAGGLFGTLWLRISGPGVGALLLLAGGALGNALNAGLQSAQHVSVGASTAVFAAVGLLAGTAALRRSGAPRQRRRPWVVVAASLALLGMLGTGGERTDVWAHAFGLLAGAALGAAAAAAWPRPPRPALQWACGALALACVLGAWRLALG